MWQDNLDKHTAIYHTSKDFSKTLDDINMSICKESTKPVNENNNNCQSTSDIAILKPKAFSKVLCPICGISTTYSRLGVHIMRHKAEKPFKCNHCKTAFTIKAELQRHNQQKHPGEHKGDNTYVCDICGKRYACASYLKSHKEVTGHNLNISNESAPKDKSVCPICGAYWSNKGRLKLHMKFHTGETPYKCDICEKACSRKLDLTTHRLTHFVDRPLKCTICRRSFKKLQLFNRHMQIHTIEKPYQCTICSKKFSKNAYLKMHMRNHTDKRPLT